MRCRRQRMHTNEDDAAQEKINKSKDDMFSVMTGFRLRVDKSSLNTWLEELKAI